MFNPGIDDFFALKRRGKRVANYFANAQLSFGGTCPNPVRAPVLDGI